MGVLREDLRDGIKEKLREEAIPSPRDEALEEAKRACQEQRSSEAPIRAPLTNAAYDEACQDCADAIDALKHSPAPAAVPEGWLRGGGGSGTRAQIAAAIFHRIADGHEVTEQQRRELLEYLGLPSASPAAASAEGETNEGLVEKVARGIRCGNTCHAEELGKGKRPDGGDWTAPPPCDAVNYEKRARELTRMILDSQAVDQAAVRIKKLESSAKHLIAAIDQNVQWHLSEYHRACVEDLRTALASPPAWRE